MLQVLGVSQVAGHAVFWSTCTDARLADTLIYLSLPLGTAQRQKGPFLFQFQTCSLFISRDTPDRTDKKGLTNKDKFIKRSNFCFNSRLALLSFPETPQTEQTKKGLIRIRLKSPSKERKIRACHQQESASLHQSPSSQQYEGNNPPDIISLFSLGTCEPISSCKTSQHPQVFLYPQDAQPPNPRLMLRDTQIRNQVPALTKLAPFQWRCRLLLGA